VSQAVYVGRLEKRMAGTTHGIPALIVGNDDQHVGAIGFGCEKSGGYQQPAQEHYPGHKPTHSSLLLASWFSDMAIVYATGPLARLGTEPLHFVPSMPPNPKGTCLVRERQ
jgi:hypothetical protein